MRRVGQVLTAVAISTLCGAGAIALVVTACGDAHPPTIGAGPSGNPPPGAPGVLTGPCTSEGETVACHVETGRSGNIVNCFNGTQTCTNGEWGPCGGSQGTMSTVVVSATSTPAPSDNMGISIRNVTTSDASATSSGCVNNPCDPYCLGIDADAGAGDAGLTVDGSISIVSIVGSVVPLSSYPSSKTGANATTCTKGDPPMDGGVLNYEECNYDYCCASDGGTGSAGTCVQWLSSTSSACSAAAPSGAVPVSNTGYAGLPSAAQQQVTSCNAADASTCPAVKGDGGTILYDTTSACDDCNYDQHCVTGHCAQWGTGQNNGSAGGVDLMLDYPCFGTVGTASTFHIPVCNRGSAPLTVSSSKQIKIGLYASTNITSGNHADCVISTPDPPDDKTIYYPTGGSVTIAPGACVDVNYNNSSLTGPGGTVSMGDIAKSGERLAVNWDSSITEVNYCNNWSAGSASACTTPYNGVDYTVGLGCADSSGSLHYPICNRGTVDSPNSGYLMLVSGTANPPSIDGTNGVCQPPSPIKNWCLIDLSVNQIKAGSCIGLSVGAAGASPSTEPGMVCDSAFTGNRTMTVNPPTGTAVPSSGNPNMQTEYGSSTYVQRIENDYCNNWSFDYVQASLGVCASYGAQPPPPTTVSYTYVATCAAGTAPVWNQFAYSTSVPTQSDVLFAATTQPLLADGGYGTATSSVKLADPGGASSTDPAICPMSGAGGSDSGVSGCPKNLTTLLGAGATNPVLNLNITLTAVTNIPVANSWSVTYNCVPNQ